MDQTEKVTDVIQKIKSLKWEGAGHVARRLDNRWTTRITMWYARPRKRPNLRLDHDIKNQAGTTWSTKARNREI